MYFMELQLFPIIVLKDRLFVGSTVKFCNLRYVLVFEKKRLFLDLYSNR